MSDNTEFEINPTSGQLVVGKQFYEDLRPLVKHPVELTSNVFRMVENLLGIPLDYVNHNLEHFRDRVNAHFESIPLEQRQPPPLRIASQVLREVVFALDEEELQEMFASLLAAAGDRETSDSVHPGFASVLSQMTPEDAHFLPKLPVVHARGSTYVQPGTNTMFDASNLVRLGIAEVAPDSWREDNERQERMNAAREAFVGLPDGTENSEWKTAETTDLITALRPFIDDLADDPLTRSSLNQIGLTRFGKAFRQACCRPLPAEGA